MFLKRRNFLIILLVLSLLSSFSIAYGEDDLGSWETKTSMPTARTELATAEIDGKIYAIGGKDTNGSSATVEEYDPTTDTWTTKTSMPTARTYYGAAEANGKIYAIGGWGIGNYDTVEEYDPTINTWTTKASMPTATRGLGVVEVNDKIYAIGGASDSSDYSTTVQEYDPITNTWTINESMGTGRKALGVAEVNGKVYAIGGRNSQGALNTVEEYDPITNKWITKTSMPTARYSLNVAEVDGKIYAIGGYNGGYLDIVEEYDPTTDTWTTKTSMPTARYDLGVVEANGKIYAIGGKNDDGNLDTVEEFTITTYELDTPANLTATAGNTEVGFSWDSVTDADSYNVYRSTTSGGPYTTVAEEVYETSYTDTDVTNGTTYYYVVTAVNIDGESDNSDEVSATPEATETLTLDIEAPSYEITGGTEFETYVSIKAASDIYAEDINITYDTSLFELVSAEVVDSDATQIYYEDTETLGAARYIVASMGSENALDGEVQILKLTFSANNIDGSGDIAVSSGIVANGDGNEIVPLTAGQTFTVTRTSYGDVNNDGNFTLGDLAIAGRLFSTTSESWETYTPDIDLSGTVEDVDLTTIVEAILANE